MSLKSVKVLNFLVPVKSATLRTNFICIGFNTAGAYYLISFNIFYLKMDSYQH